jgi:stage II sporulation protein E
LTTDVVQIRSRSEGVLKKVLGILLFIAAGVLLARIQLLSALCPFGPAFVSACFLARRDISLFAAAGVITGALLAPQTLCIVTVTLLICAAMLFLGNPVKWMVMMSTACAYLVATIIFKTDSLSSFMAGILECLISLVMVYVLANLIQIFSNKNRTIFSAEETICLALGALMAVCMFGPLNLYGIYIGDIAAMFLVLCAAYTGGAALGAGVGLALGMALCLGISAQVSSIGMLGISGLAAGTIRKLKKPGTAIAFVMICLLFIIAFYNASVWYLAFIEAVIAAFVFTVIPGKVFAFAGKFFDTQARREYEYKLHSRRLKELTAGRLKEVSQVFLQTGDMFSREASERIKSEFNISGVLSIVAESTCRDCVFRKSCWDKDFLNTYNVFNKLFMIYEKNGQIDKENVDPSFIKKCFNIGGILSSAESIFSAYLLNVKWTRKIEESRLITGKQLKGVAKVVSDIGRDLDTGFNFIESVEQGIIVSLDAIGIHAKEVCAENTSGGGISVAVRVKSCEGMSDCKSVMEKTVSGVCGVRMRRVGYNGCKGKEKYCTLRFEQARRFKIITAAANAAKGEISGDSYSFKAVKDGRFMITLCDGMGSGEKARNESAETVSLIENFYKAGFDENIIYETINRLLVLKESGDVFSTVDMCMIDLKTGCADFTKIGAESSYIIRGGKVSAVTPGSLPIGIIEEVEPACTRTEILPGDIIVMVSDGIADRMGKDADGWFSDIDKSDIQAMADAVLAKAKGESTPDDDMTVITALVREMT